MNPTQAVMNELPDLKGGATTSFKETVCVDCVQTAQQQQQQLHSDSDSDVVE